MKRNTTTSRFRYTHIPWIYLWLRTLRPSSHCLRSHRASKQAVLEALPSAYAPCLIASKLFPEIYQQTLSIICLSESRGMHRRCPRRMCQPRIGQNTSWNSKWVLIANLLASPYTHVKSARFSSTSEMAIGSPGGSK